MKNLLVMSLLLFFGSVSWASLDDLNSEASGSYSSADLNSSNNDAGEGGEENQGVLSKASTASCGKDCQRKRDLEASNLRLDNLSKRETSTYTETMALADQIQGEVDYAQSQVKRFSRHQGFWNDRKKKERKWRKRKAKALDALNATLEIAQQFFDGSETEIAALESRISNNASTASAELAAVAELDKLGVKAEEFTSEELLALKNAGQAAKAAGSSGGSKSASGSGEKKPSGNRGVATAAGGDSALIGAKGSSSGYSSASSSGGGAAGGTDGETASGEVGDDGLDTRGNTMTSQEANGYQTIFNGAPIGIAGASLFGIVQKKYKDKDKSNSFFRRER